MDENQTTDAAGNNGPESLDIVTSMSQAADSINVDTFAFLVVPLAVTLVVTIALVIILAIRRSRNRRTFDKLIGEEMAAAEKSAKPLALEVLKSDEGWTVPNSEELQSTPDLTEADSDGNAPAEKWQMPAIEDATSPSEIEFADQSAVAVPSEVAEVRAQGADDWMSRLRQGLARTRESLTKGFSAIFGLGRKLDAKTLEQLHEQLYRADIGVKTCDRLIKVVESRLGGKDSVSFDEVAEVIRGEVSKILGAVQRPIQRPPAAPWVILVVGVNGVGKTTTIGKLSAHFLAEGKTVLLAAADTFRAAAIEQLQTWGDRLGVDVIAHQAGADPAAVAFDAVKAAKSRGHDILIIDTAGRLHSKKELMDELGKIYRVIGKDLPGAPHETWLVIDATTGQNANMQVAAFKEVVQMSGLVITKLDGTAKGGVVVGIADQHQIPIRFIGVGEKAADLREFSADDFSKTLI